MNKLAHCIFLAIFVTHTLYSCTTNEPTSPPQPKEEYITMDINKSSPKAFYYSIDDALENAETPEKKLKLGDSIYLLAKEKQWIPIVFADTAVFLYRHSSTNNATVEVFGDLNGWSTSESPQISLSRYADTRLYAGIYKAPSTTTRVD